MKTDLYIEIQGTKIEHKVILDAAKEIWKAEGNKVKDLQSMELYYKPEEGNCYYVFNGKIKGSFAV